MTFDTVSHYKYLASRQTDHAANSRDEAHKATRSGLHVLTLSVKTEWGDQKSLSSKASFYNLNLLGVNPAAVAYYEFNPDRTIKADGDISESPYIKLVLSQGDMLEIEGDEAQALYEQFQQSGSSTSSLSKENEKQNAVELIRTFLHAQGYEFIPSHVAEALSVLGAG